MSLSLTRAWAPLVQLRPNAGRFLLAAAAGLLGLLHVALTSGLAVVSPADPVWQHLQGGRAQAVLGAEAFLADPHWHFPLSLTDRLLSGGAPVPIIYTDSAPWIAIAGKALGLGPDRLSVIGLVVFLAIALQPVAFALLLLAMGVRRSESVLAGALLGAMLPAWYMRLVWHQALASHWIIILALALACVAIRNGVSWRVVIGFAVLGPFAIGIHAYLFVMVAAIAAGGLLADLGRGRPTRATSWRAAAGFGSFLGCSAVTAWILGYGPTGMAGGFGKYSMNLLSPFVPQYSALLAAATGDSGPLLDPTGGQYEGFNYLGAGILLTLAAALIAARVGRMRAYDPSVRRAAWPLCGALLALTLFAVGNRVYAGNVLLLDIGLPLWLQHLSGELRSSGRMFWPMAYASIAWSVLVLDKLPRRPVAGALLAIAVVLQAGDTAVVRQALAAEYAVQPPLFPRRFSPEDIAWWRNGPLAGQNLRLLPSLLCAGIDDQELIRQLALTVEREGGTVEGGPVARADPAICAREQIDAALAPDATSPPGERGWVQLLLPDSLPPAALVLPRQSGRCAALPEGIVCGDAVVAAMRAGLL